MRIFRLAFAPLLAGSMSACSTLTVNYQAAGAAAPSRHAVVAVGDVGSDHPYPDPARIRFNATLDRPVTQAVREGLVAELRQAGFTVGDGARIVTAETHDLVMDATDQSILFTISDKRSGQALYRRPFHFDRGIMGSIFDAEGFVKALRSALQQFTADPQALAILSAPAPEPEAPSAPAAETSAAPASAAAPPGKPWWQ